MWNISYQQQDGNARMKQGHCQLVALYTCTRSFHIKLLVNPFIFSDRCFIFTNLVVIVLSTFWVVSQRGVIVTVPCFSCRFTGETGQGLWSSTPAGHQDNFDLWGLIFEKLSRQHSIRDAVWYIHDSFVCR